MCQGTSGSLHSVMSLYVTPGHGFHAPPDSGFCSPSPTGSALWGWHCLEGMILPAQQQRHPEICVSCKHHSYRTFNALTQGMLSAQTYLACPG